MWLFFTFIKGGINNILDTIWENSFPEGTLGVITDKTMMRDLTF